MTQRMMRFAPLTIAVVLAACEPAAGDKGTESGGAMPQRAPSVTVQEQARHLAVSVPNGEIGETDWVRIDTFLAVAGRPQNVHLAVAADPSAPAIYSIVRHALAFGYTADNIDVTRVPVAPSRRDRIELTARTYAAVLPNCPQTGHINLIDGNNTVSSDWGCAASSMLGLQVADPRDLVVGRNGGETDSVMTTAAIQRLQTDKLKKLESTSTQSTGGGQ